MDRLDKLILSSTASEVEADGERQPNILPASGTGKSCGYTQAELRRKYGDGWNSYSIDVDGRPIPIHMAVVPGGRRIPLLKAMLSTACERNCFYCSFHSDRNYRRITFTPEDLATTFHSIHKNGKVDGLFLSAGVIGGGPNSQNKLLDTAEILRHKLGYRGYLHLKIMPGAQHGQVLRAMQLADRVSVNLESPNQERLSYLAPTKQFLQELLTPLRWMQEIRTNHPRIHGWGGHWPSSTTQFVVGPAGESDLELLATVSHLVQVFGLSRTYFEAFNPVLGTPLESHPAENPLRQHRLYQASYLLRDYGFHLEDLTFTQDGRLPLQSDPKIAYAQAALAEDPIEVNKADRSQLLRIPGIGPRSAGAILRARKVNQIRELSDLRKLGILTERAAPYITIQGRQPERQLSLF